MKSRSGSGSGSTSPERDRPKSRSGHHQESNHSFHTPTGNGRSTPVQSAFPSPSRSPFRLSSSSKPSFKSHSRSRGPSFSDSDGSSFLPSSSRNHQDEDSVDQRAVEHQLGLNELDTGIGPSLTRVNFYDVVLEDMTNGGNLNQFLVGNDAEGERDSSILPWLGNVVVDHQGNDPDGQLSTASNGMPRSSSGNSITAVVGGGNGDSSTSNSSNNSEKFKSRMQELVETEKSYVTRLEALYHRYAVPLRQLARDRDTAIIPLYEAQRLFGNVGEVLGANQAFLKELEALLKQGVDECKRKIGDVVYKHMACFGCYNEYYSNFEKAKHIEQNMSKTNKGFRDFTDRTKYSLTNIGNTGLRDLLMEPVQRIPRYKLMLEGLIKYMVPTDPQRARLEESVVLASRIASCEADDKTKKAAVLWSFQRSVDDFPPALVSAQREFIDCVDVDDFPLSDFSNSTGGSSAGLFSPGGGTSTTSSRTLHCTLFLFDDRLAIVKRASSTINGRRVVGLDDLNRLADQMRTFSERSGNGHSREMSNGRKGDLGFRGMLDISDVIGTDLGGTDFQLTFAQSPSHVSAEKWSSRLVRQYVTSDSNSLSSSRGPPTSSTSHCTPARLEKARFLENLWRAQALHKTREHRSHVRCLVIPQEKRERERNESGSSWPGDESARRLVYWNIYGRRSYLTEPNKSSIVLHVDLRNDADPLPFGPELIKPHAQMRISSVDEQYGEAAYTTSIKGRPDDDEQLILSLPSLASRLDDLNADACVSNPDFQPTTPSSQPSTPASHRGRVVTGLENFGRNLLFGTPGSIRSAAGSIDVFGSPAKRTKSTMSKSTFTSNSNSNSDNLSSAHGFSTPATSFSSRPGGLLGPPDSSSLSPKRLGVRPGRASSVGPADAISQVEAVNEHTPKRSSAVLAQNGMDWEASPGPPSREHLRQRAKSTPARDVTDQQLAVAQSSGARDLSRSASRVLGPRDLTSPPPSSSDSPARATSPSRRKPVPTQLGMGGDGKSCPSPRVGHSTSPKRVSSGSKRAMPFDASEDQAAKRQAHTGSDGVPSPAATARPLSPQRTEKERDYSRPSSPLRNNGESRRPRSPNHHSSERAPNVSQKDDQDGRTLTQEELTRRVLRNLERAQDEEKRSRKGVEQIRTEVRSLRNSLRRATGKEKSRAAADSPMREKQNNGRVSPSRDLASEGYEALRRGPLSPTFLEDWMTSIEQWLADADERFQDAASTQKRLRGDVQIMARLYSDSTTARSTFSPSRSKPQEPLVDEEKENLRKEAAEAKALRTQVQALTRKCELLTALESDGRLENTELHKAFNDELDQMYEDTQQPENVEVESLRRQVKQAKAERNQLRIESKALTRERDLEKSQSEVYRRILSENHLL